MRTIRDHHVFGKAVIVDAFDEVRAREEVKKITPLYVWEIKLLPHSSRMWEAYVSEEAFATND